MEYWVNKTELIQNTINYLVNKFNKNYLDCNDLMQLTGLGKNSIRNLMAKKSFPSTKFGSRVIVYIPNYVIWAFENGEKNVKEAKEK